MFLKKKKKEEEEEEEEDCHRGKFIAAHLQKNLSIQPSM